MKYITSLGGDSETTPMKGGFFKKYKW
jgi:hypothetical protein